MKHTLNAGGQTRLLGLSEPLLGCFSTKIWFVLTHGLTPKSHYDEYVLSYNPILQLFQNSLHTKECQFSIG